jgi:acetyl-CoA C-acetyltransferase
LLDTGPAPIGAIRKALVRAKVDQGDSDSFEIDETSCSVPVAAMRALGIEQEIRNVSGSG